MEGARDGTMRMMVERPRQDKLKERTGWTWNWLNSVGVRVRSDSGERREGKGDDEVVLD
jgi:hypothetical protein